MSIDIIMEVDRVHERWLEATWESDGNKMAHPSGGLGNTVYGIHS